MTPLLGGPNTLKDFKRQKKMKIIIYCIQNILAFIKAAYSVTMNIFRKKNIFFVNHL